MGIPFLQVISALSIKMKILNMNLNSLGSNMLLVTYNILINENVDLQSHNLEIF